MFILSFVADQSDKQSQWHIYSADVW